MAEPSTNVSFENARRFTPMLGPDGRIMMTVSPPGPSEKNLTVGGLIASARLSPEGSEGEARFTSLATALQERTASQATDLPSRQIIGPAPAPHA